MIVYPKLETKGSVNWTKKKVQISIWGFDLASLRKVGLFLVNWHRKYKHLFRDFKLKQTQTNMWHIRGHMFFP